MVVLHFTCSCICRCARAGEQAVLKTVWDMMVASLISMSAYLAAAEVSLHTSTKSSSNTSASSLKHLLNLLDQWDASGLKQVIMHDAIKVDVVLVACNLMM